jgi:hypothetical protein
MCCRYGCQLLPGQSEKTVRHDRTACRQWIKTSARIPLIWRKQAPP